ncbi:MAG: hypothetical protein AAGF58_06620 [Pseudomonadota bacterium]
MPRLIDQVAAVDRDYFINAIGKLKSPVFDMDRAIGMGHIATIHICNARHCRPFTSIWIV